MCVGGGVSLCVCHYFVMTQSLFSTADHVQELLKITVLDMSLYVTCTNLIKLDNDAIETFLWTSGKLPDFLSMN